MLLAFAGVVGLWGIGFFSFDLIRTVFRKHFEAQGLDAPARSRGKLTFWTGITSLVQNAGAFFGIYAFTCITARHRPQAGLRHLVRAGGGRHGVHVLVCSTTFWQIFWMIPIMGFCQLALFGGYAIYFPELFPTRLRSTGTSFCYNVGRLVAAAGPSVLGLLTSKVFAGYPRADALRRRDHVLGVLPRPARPALRPRDQGQPLPE